MVVHTCDKDETERSIVGWSLGKGYTVRKDQSS